VHDEFTDVMTYVGSETYSTDLAAAQAVWSAPGVLEAAGSLVLLTYFSVPDLLAVQAAGSGSPRTAIDGHREQRFLREMLGLTVDERRGGGFGNPAVRESIVWLGKHHLGYPGMTGEFMEFIAEMLTMSPLRVQPLIGGPAPSTEEVDHYWRYMCMGMSLLGARLRPRPDAEAFITGFTERRARPCALGRELIGYYLARHPTPVRGALRGLAPAARAVVETVQSEGVERLRFR
jgi:hypothetical protein